MAVVFHRLIGPRVDVGFLVPKWEVEMPSSWHINIQYGEINQQDDADVAID